MAQGPPQERAAPEEPGGSQAGVSIAGLARGGITDALTTEQINQLLEDKPEWLVAERESYQSVLREERRLKALHADTGSRGLWLEITGEPSRLTDAFHIE